ncbi:hypothetical protein V8F20_009385 [Naviculisporaceae sp. PSN 640]
MTPTPVPIIRRPIAAAHFMIFPEGKDPTVIPTAWADIRFDAVDILYIHGFSTNQNGELALGYYKDTHYDLHFWLDWILKTARKANPDIKIFAQQNYLKDDILNKGPGFYKIYAESVPTLLEKLHLDGFDYDYEPGQVHEDVIRLFTDIHTQCSKKGFLTSISPSETMGLFTRTSTAEDLANVRNCFDHVNVQTYDGGLHDDNSLEAWLRVFPADRILVGINPEQSGNPNKAIPSVQQTEDWYKNGDGRGNRLAGFHLWRLNSDVLLWENATQVMVYDYLHGTKGGKAQNVNYDRNKITTEWYHSHDEHKQWKKITVPKVH